MLNDAKNLGDPETATDHTPDWVPAFKHGVDGMILVTGECRQTVADKLAEVERIFLVGAPSATIHEAIRIVGDVRPGKEKGHEQFVTPIWPRVVRPLTTIASVSRTASHSRRSVVLMPLRIKGRNLSVKE